MKSVKLSLCFICLFVLTTLTAEGISVSANKSNIDLKTQQSFIKEGSAELRVDALTATSSNNYNLKFTQTQHENLTGFNNTEPRITSRNKPRKPFERHINGPSAYIESSSDRPTNTNITQTPEPATLLLFGLSLTGVGFIRRLRKK